MCTCIASANRALAPHNTELDLRACLNMKTGKETHVMTVPTRKINQRKRQPLYVLIVKYCPLCGEERKP